MMDYEDPQARARAMQQQVTDAQMAEQRQQQSMMQDQPGSVRLTNPSEQQKSMDPGAAGLAAYKGISGGLSGSGAGGAAAGSGGASGGAAGGGAASAGGSSSGAASTLASAGPWAALAAVIIGNEYSANQEGYRAENDGQRVKDAFSGKVLRQDADRWTDKLGGDDKLGLTGDMKLGASLGSPASWKNVGSDFKNTTIGKFLGKLF